MEVGEAFDLRRMFLGDAPLLFYLEIVVRTVVMYLWALLMLRVMGKRGLRQLSPFDFVIIIALGSAVGDPMFYPQVPLLHGMTVITVIILLERSLAFGVQSRENVERFIEGVPVRLVADGRLDLKGMRSEAIGREELFTVLRSSRAQQLGEVKRAYLEQDGRISVFLHDPAYARPGLPLIPPWELKPPPVFKEGGAAPNEGLYACLNCGETEAHVQGEIIGRCPQCDHNEWTIATRDPIVEFAPDA